jgi:hypothetical protein
MIDSYTMDLQAGDTISIGKFKVKPLRLKEIKQIREANYNYLLSALLIDKEQLKDKPEYDAKESIYEIVLEIAKEDMMFQAILLEALKTFTDEEFRLTDEGLVFLYQDDEEILVTEEDFINIRSVVRKQNYIFDDDKDAFNPANEKAKQLRERLNKIKGDMQKKNKTEGLKLTDIISIVSAYSKSINIFNIWDLTIYQLHEEYLRLIIWDNYHVSEMHRPHMESDAQKNIKHWSRPVDPKNI